jgi:hypothetical protein
VDNPDGSSSQLTTSAGIQADPDFTQVVSPWGNFSGGMSTGQFILWSSPGFTLPDPSLPTQLNIADWSTEHQVFLAHNFGDSGDSTNGTFSLDAEITSITLAPEPETMAVLGLGVASCVLFRRKRRSQGR